MLFVLVTGVWLSWSVANEVVQDQARDEALSWAEYIERNLTDLKGVIAGQPIADHDRGVLDLARDAGNVFRYHIFDPTGRIMFSSDFFARTEAFEVLAGADQKRLDEALLGGSILIEIADGAERPDRPASYAEAYVPLFDGSRLIGVIEVYVDMTAKVARYWETMGMAITALAGLLAAAATLPGLYIWHQFDRIRRAEAHIHDLAYRDSLTGLGNRRMFHNNLEMAFASAAETDMEGALFILDLDNFKEVNDRLGHHVGDGLLEIVAERIRSVLREGDHAARLGGDEFAIILPPGVPIERVEEVAQTVQAEISRRVNIDGSEVATSVSIGIARFPGQGATTIELMKNADMALYQAKHAGRARHAWYTGRTKPEWKTENLAAGRALVDRSELGPV
ncbi:MAG: diguanylate cyclase [Geminicoccaceae bacterium]